jgi:hypothetical protein
MKRELSDRMLSLARNYDNEPAKVIQRIDDDSEGERCFGIASFARWLVEQPVPLVWPRVRRGIREHIEGYAKSRVNGIA